VEPPSSHINQVVPRIQAKDAEQIEVVMEPTRNAWVALGGLVPPPRRDGGDGATRAVR
jgi:hypothetical protein